jgi:hypothetical protein
MSWAFGAASRNSHIAVPVKPIAATVCGGGDKMMLGMIG